MMCLCSSLQLISPALSLGLPSSCASNRSGIRAFVPNGKSKERLLRRCYGFRLLKQQPPPRFPRVSPLFVSALAPWLVSRRTIMKHLVPIGQTLRQLLRRSWLALSAPPALRHPCTGLTYGAHASRSIPSTEPILSRCTIQELFSLP